MDQVLNSPPTEETYTRTAFPKDSFKEALKIAQALENKNSGNPLPPQDVAIALGKSPGSSDFRVLLSSSIKYGLTSGSYNTPRISLTDLGKDAVEPKDENSRKIALANSAFKPELFSKVFNYYKGKKVPEITFFENTVSRDFGIPKKQATVFVEIFMENVNYLGLIKKTTSGPWFASETSSAILTDESEAPKQEEIFDGNGEVQAESEAIPLSKQDQAPSKIFIAHGENKKPLDQLTNMLDKFKVPYIIAVDEPNRALPVSEKIAGLMKQCSAGIFIFTADEKFTNEKEEEIYKPSENVIYELGAASVLYGNKIVIFKEEGISFPSDFSGIGYTSFQKDNLSAKAPELLTELVQFNLVKLTVQ